MKTIKRVLKLLLLLLILAVVGILFLRGFRYERKRFCERLGTVYTGTGTADTGNCGYNSHLGHIAADEYIHCPRDLPRGLAKDGTER